VDYRTILPLGAYPSRDISKKTILSDISKKLINTS